MTPPVVLSIAATDSGGGAGLTADLATFAALGVHGACVVTALTAQDTTAVHAVHTVPTEVVAAQLDAVLGDLPVAAVKAGVLASVETVRLVAERCAHLPIVVDPVLRATTGAVLADAEVTAAYRELLLPVAALITPNAAEARVLLGRDGPPERLAAELADHGPAVIVTGGAPAGVDGADVIHGADVIRGADVIDEVDCVDWLAVPGHAPQPLRHPVVPTANDHGTGCTFSAAVTAHLPADLPHTGPPTYSAEPLATRARRAPEALGWIAVRAARFTTAQLARSSTWELGRGRGPIAHITADTTTGEHR
ncbi:bifunctional hydroxymethylpyrimidine kinase/phosphomethylpyrimidine kinase [Nocardioides sp.]|uniref:bifunctional hydroxymethylpyrimidine kinase/phosphomethylpyrimidine kinase n=1 Tax=Nocardioides sp. TaxID=35761 RepID=UPI002CB32C6F|nr:bifunctional hydroxymethylpyrimidine kinase/phosphomethylpyrimidine kinase [Nocardioides sp.]HVX53730.1 bifunctional hydroxymethylpyrimidine kinase/phosphomethylpyrimidine kinase [Nocardioides sp.]